MNSTAVQLSVLSAPDFDSLRIQLRHELSEDDTGSFVWAVPATITTDAYIDNELRRVTSYIAFDPGRFDLHLRIAAELLDRAMARQAELSSLEERAISTLLELKLAASVQPFNLVIAKAGLLADLAQGLVEGNSVPSEELGAMDALTELDQIQTAARKGRLLMHNSSGHALNYGERITRHRQLLFDSVRGIQERLAASRKGLAHSGAQALPPVPEWDGQRSGNLSALVTWTRDAIRLYEQLQVDGFAYKRALRLGSDGLLSGGSAALAEELAIDRDHQLRFTIANHLLGQGGVSRLIDVTVAIQFCENTPDFTDGLANPTTQSHFSMVDGWHRQQRQQFTMSCKLTPPAQSVELDGQNVSWSRPAADFFEIPAWWNGGGQAYQQSGSHLSGINPIGEWTLDLARVLRSDSGVYPISTLRKGINGYLWQINDIVISLQLLKLG